MICRHLRRFSAWQSCLLLAVFVAFGGLVGFAVPPPLPAEDEAPAITIRGPEVPPAALAQALGNRSEKQAQTNRQALPKLARTSHITSADLQQLYVNRLIVHRQFRNLPPRLLPARHSSLHACGDDDDPSLF
jgi:hypothetical protein